jgi:hypothetical protein
MRDTHATGTGSIMGAGTAGYCVGNLLMEGAPLPHEDPEAAYPETLAPPLQARLAGLQCVRRFACPPAFLLLRARAPPPPSAPGPPSPKTHTQPDNPRTTYNPQSQHPHPLPQTPPQILVDASNGASDYGNKFGEPLVAGYTRTFGQRLPNGERRVGARLGDLLGVGGSGVPPAPARRRAQGGRIARGLGGWAVGRGRWRSPRAF